MSCAERSGGANAFEVGHLVSGWEGWKTGNTYIINSVWGVLQNTLYFLVNKISKDLGSISPRLLPQS